jgi:Glycosyltransferase family 9 (heptosyltransferase)
LSAPGVAFVSLQRDVRDADRAELAKLPALLRLDETLADFADTAAVIAQLDLVIAVDTAVAHLAGALGKPVWMLNRFDSCWRWLLNRDDTPWYPSMRQFRQTSRGDWAGVIERVGDALRTMTARTV